uniref:FecR family protein n=1 Tax=Pedobacter schmidteae TaxID=2201271 RepID=UPI0013CE4934|nr:FecR domain-containing protein [Pedobacter schmidteae]
MDARNAKKLIEKFQEGTASKDETALIEKWIVLGNVKNLDLSDEELKNDVSDIRDRLPLKYRDQALKLMPIWRYIRVAAAVVTVTLGVWLYTSHYYGGNQAKKGSRYAMDVSPGKHAATLTLSDGKTIKLDEEKAGIVIGEKSLAYNDGTRVSTQDNRNDDQMLTATTPRAGTYQLTLSDGTKLWLNADSKVSFPSRFYGAQRTVMLLNGEAYFEVTKNDKKPFIVLTEDQKLEVLGTHFNISAYKDENNTKTTLLEGAVQVSLLKKEDVAVSKKAAVKLLPGQQAILSKNIISVVPVNTDHAVDWKNGDFIFKDEGLESVMRKVARWYDVEIVYKSDYPQQVKLGGFISRYRDLSAVLQLIESTGKVHFEIKDKSIIVGR